MKLKRLFCFFFSAFLFLFFLYFNNINICASTYIEGGVDIERDFGIRQYEPSVNPYFTIDVDGSTHSVYKVTDDNWKNSAQPSIIIDLNDYGISDQIIYYGGYRTIVLIFQLTLAEIDDGYQEFYLVDPNSSNQHNLASLYTTFEHGSGYKNLNYKRYEFYAEFHTSALTSSLIEIGFSAHGNGEDSWCFF